CPISVSSVISPITSISGWSEIVASTTSRMRRGRFATKTRIFSIPRSIEHTYAYWPTSISGKRRKNKNQLWFWVQTENSGTRCSTGPAPPMQDVPKQVPRMYRLDKRSLSFPKKTGQLLDLVGRSNAATAKRQGSIFRWGDPACGTSRRPQNDHERQLSATSDERGSGLFAQPVATGWRSLCWRDRGQLRGPIAARDW